MKNFLSIYKLHLLLSLTLVIIITAIGVETKPLNIAFITLGAFLGTFLLDIEYFLFTYILEPAHHFSKTFGTYIKHKDFGNALIYAHKNSQEVPDKTLNSVLFQIALAIMCIVTLTTTIHIFTKTLLLAGFVNSIYRLVEKFYSHTTDEWFWAIKSKPNSKQTALYLVALVGILAICISLL